MGKENEKRIRLLENFSAKKEEYLNDLYGEHMGNTTRVLNFVMICIEDENIKRRIRNIIVDPQNIMELELATLYMKAFTEYYSLKERLLMGKEREIPVENNPAIEPLISIINQLKSGKSLDTIEEPDSIKGLEGKYTYLFLISLNSQAVKEYIQNKTGIELNNQDRAEETKTFIDKVSLMPLFYKGIPKSVVDQEIINEMKKYASQFHLCCEQEKASKKAKEYVKTKVIPPIVGAKNKVLSLWKQRKK